MKSKNSKHAVEPTESSGSSPPAPMGAPPGKQTGRTMIIDGAEQGVYESTPEDAKKFVSAVLRPHVEAIINVRRHCEGIVFVQHDVMGRARRAIKRLFRSHAVIGLTCDDAVDVMGEQDPWTEAWLREPPTDNQVKVWLFVHYGTLLLTFEKTPNGLVVSKLPDRAPPHVALA